MVPGFFIARVARVWLAHIVSALRTLAGVHLLDAGGRRVGQLDFTKETDYRSVSPSDRWSNSVPRGNVDLRGVDALGVALYDS